jgi:hypothetical protein
MQRCMVTRAQFYFGVWAPNKTEGKGQADVAPDRGTKNAGTSHLRVE